MYLIVQMLVASWNTSGADRQATNHGLSIAGISAAKIDIAYLRHDVSSLIGGFLASLPNFGVLSGMLAETRQRQSLQYITYSE